MTKRIAIKTALFALYAAVTYCFFFLGLFDWIGTGSENFAVTVSIILIALGLGTSAQIIFDWHGTRSSGQVFKNALWVLLAASVVLFAIQAETLICILMASPIILAGLAFGITVARWVNTKVNERTSLSISLLVLPFLIPWIAPDGIMKTGTYAVTTEIVMQADIDTVRDMVLDVPLIHDDERPWTFTHSVLRAPRPVSAETRDGVRYATWEKGVKFQEVMSETTDPNVISWTFDFPDPTLMYPVDVRVSPTGPDVIMNTGTYQLTQVDADQTLVTLTTEYRLHTPMNWYYAAWGKLFLNDFHTAVLHVLAGRVAG